MNARKYFGDIPKALAICALAGTALPAFAQTAVIVPNNGDLQPNLLQNPGFDDKNDCTTGWEVHRTEATVKCHYSGATWLNYNDQGEDPSVSQSVDVTVGKTYILSVGYRAGPTAETYAKGKSDYFAIKVDDLLVDDDRTTVSDDWTVARVEFTPKKPKVLIQLIGEYKSDGDVLVNYASLKEVSDSKVIASTQKESSLPSERTNVLAYSVNDEEHSTTDTAKDFFIGLEGEKAVIVKNGALPIKIVPQPEPGIVAFRVTEGDLKDQYLIAGDDGSYYSTELESGGKFAVHEPLENTDSSFASFESVDKPGEFLRHQAFLLKLDPASSDSPRILRRDATFRFQPPR